MMDEADIKQGCRDLANALDEAVSSLRKASDCVLFQDYEKSYDWQSEWDEYLTCARSMIKPSIDYIWLLRNNRGQLEGTGAISTKTSLASWLLESALMVLKHSQAEGDLEELALDQSRDSIRNVIISLQRLSLYSIPERRVEL